MTSDEIIENLVKEFPEPKCELHFRNNYELLVAVILSAQCTDERVNKVTKDFFNKYPDVFSLSKAEINEVEKEIKSCGLFHNKAKNLVLASREIVDKHYGVIPSSFDDLIKLCGVGRKTANVVLGVGFAQNTIAVDTHVFRVSNRLGIAKSKNVIECEKKLQKKFNSNDWTKLHYMLVLFGRYICKAKNPQCERCPFNDKCEYIQRRG